MLSLTTYLDNKKYGKNFIQNCVQIMISYYLDKNKNEFIINELSNKHQRLLYLSHIIFIRKFM